MPIIKRVAESEEWRNYLDGSVEMRLPLPAGGVCPQMGPEGTAEKFRNHRSTPAGLDELVLSPAEAAADGPGPVLRRGLCSGNRLQSLRVDHHKPSGANARRSRRQPRLRQRQMQDPALPRAHRRKRVRSARRTDSFDGNVGHHVELPGSRRLEALGIEADAVVLLRLQPQNLGGDVLDGVQQLSIAGEQQRSIAASEFDGNLGA